MNELDFLQQYTDAVKHSTDHTRQVLLLMVGASIVICAAFWNSRPTSWAGARLAVARAIVQILSHEEERKKNPLAGEFQVPSGQEELYAFAAESAHRSSITLYEAQQNLNRIQQVRGEQINKIQVPMSGISGVNFDINDLGVFGGFVLLVLLIWETYALWRYADNLRLAFDHIREISAKQLDGHEQNILLYHTYQRLAMHQVLMIPPPPASKNSKTGQLKLFLRNAPWLMCALPCLVQTTIVLNDWATRKYALPLYPQGIFQVLIFGTMIWLVILGLTFFCFLILRKASFTWQEVAKEI